MSIATLGLGAHMYLSWHMYEDDCADVMPAFVFTTIIAGVHGFLSTLVYFSPYLSKRDSGWVTVASDVVWLIEYASTIMVGLPPLQRRVESGEA